MNRIFSSYLGKRTKIIVNIFYELHNLCVICYNCTLASSPVILTVQHPVHLNRDRLSAGFFSGASGRPQQGLQQHSRRKNLVAALQLKQLQQQQQQHTRRFSLPQNVSVVGGGTAGGAMPSAPIESDLAFFFRLPQQTQHENHRRGRTPAAFAATTVAAAAVAGRPFRFRPQHFPHSRGRRFHTAAQHFLERLSAAIAETAAAVPAVEVGGRLPTVGRR